MIRLICFFSAVLFLTAGCVSATTKMSQDYTATKSWPRRDLSGSEKAAIASTVRAALKDPDSAQFKWLPYAENPDGIYCGFVNAKNSFGGYNGFAPFAVGFMSGGGKPVTSFVSMDNDLPEAYRRTESLCARNGFWAYTGGH